MNGTQRAILNALRTGVKVANRTVPQPMVTFKRAIADSSYGGWSYPTSVELPAVVDWKQKQVRTLEGVLSVSRASVLFLDVAKVAAATAGQGISDHDIIILPDGTTGPILDMAGFIDAGTEQPIATEVYLG